MTPREKNELLVLSVGVATGLFVLGVAVLAMVLL